MKLADASHLRNTYIVKFIHFILQLDDSAGYNVRSFEKVICNVGLTRAILYIDGKSLFLPSTFSSFPFRDRYFNEFSH